MKKQYLTINTDDFGLSKGINRAVKDAFLAGVLTDASLMANGPEFEEAVNISIEHGLPIAAHINLIRGKMLTDFKAYPSILTLWKNSLYKKEIYKIEKEARVQIEKILKSEIKINQLNSEKHAHFFPTIFKLWVKLAEEYKIPYIRFIKEFNIVPSLQGIKANLLSVFSIKNRLLLKSSSVKITDNFTGIIYTGIIDERILTEKIIKNLKNGWTEFMVHIGYNEPIDRSMGSYFLLEQREKELVSLLSTKFKDIISKQNIKLINFGGFNE